MKQHFITETEYRLRNILEAFGRGEDVSPAERYRTEGFMQAGVYLGLATEQQLSELLVKLQQAILNIEDQRVFADQLCIPILMKRAPVTPST